MVTTGRYRPASPGREKHEGAVPAGALMMGMKDECVLRELEVGVENSLKP